MPVRRLAEETGITDSTLYTWRKRALPQGDVVPGAGNDPNKWSSEEKFAVVLETASLNEAELSEYCRKKGLYPEQVTEWKHACLKANVRPANKQKILSEERKRDKKIIKSLSKELKRKDKALAETAALLVLKKKAQAIWGDPEED